MTGDTRATTTPPQTASLTQASLVPVAPVAPPRPRRRRRWLIGAALLVVAGLAGALLFHGGGTGPAVPVAQLSPAPVDRVLIVSGRTESDRTAELTAAVSGTVTQLRAEEGAQVVEGEELVLIDDSRAQAGLRQAMAALDAAILNRQQAEDDFARAQALGRSISQVERDRAAKGAEAAQLEVQRLSAAVDQARLALDDYRIKAPITGTVLERRVDPGEVVQPGQLLMRLADLSRLRVEVEVDESYAAALRTGQPAAVQFAGQDRVLNGRVGWIAPEVNTVTGAVPVRIFLDSLPAGAQVGLTAVVNIVVATREAGLTVPRQALVDAAGSPAVFVLRDGQARLTPIGIVDWPSERVEVTHGLEPGDVVILAPDGLSDGQPVTATNPSAGG